MGRHASFGRASSCHFSQIPSLPKAFMISPLNNSRNDSYSIDMIVMPWKKFNITSTLYFSDVTADKSSKLIKSFSTLLLVALLLAFFFLFFLLFSLL